MPAKNKREVGKLWIDTNWKVLNIYVWEDSAILIFSSFILANLFSFFQFNRGIRFYKYHAMCFLFIHFRGKLIRVYFAEVTLFILHPIIKIFDIKWKHMFHMDNDIGWNYPNCQWTFTLHRMSCMVLDILLTKEKMCNDLVTKTFNTSRDSI